MSAPSFLESHISQIPALRLLQQLGYTYLSPEEVAVERRGKRRHVLLEDVLATQLKRLNRIAFKGRELPFTDNNVAKAIESLREVPFDGLVRTSEKIYDLLTLGKSLEQTIEGETKGFTLRYIDWAHPRNNTFHVTAEFEVERTGSLETRRPDIVCFVNGIPFVVIECKRPDEKDSLEAAVKQTLRNWRTDEIPQLFLYSQLALALNKNAGLYATAGTPPKFWSKWRELGATDAELRTAIHGPVRREDHEKLFRGVFTYAKEAFEEMSLTPREPTEQDWLVWALCRPERLIEMARQFVLYDEGGTVKKVARYQQYFVIRRTLERVRQRNAGGTRKGGVVWQTQGSGKSLAMVLLGKALALDEGIPNPRIVLVTDRIDLDEQIWKTFHQCGKDPQMAKTGRHLQELLADERVGVITTVLDKFRAAANASKEFRVKDDNIFVLVDESHRSQYGEANTRMSEALPRACFIGFTGTPLMKKDKSTAHKFGGFIEPAYTIRDAVEDHAVVPLLYEGRHVLQDVNTKAVDTMFEAMCEGLTPEQKADLKRKFASQNELNRLESRLYLIAWDVSQHFSAQWKGTGFKGQLTAPGKKEALVLKRFLDQFGKVTSEVVISAPDDREGEDAASADESVVRFWKGMMERYGSEKEYNRQIIQAFKKGDTPEILIVVDKLLTGFDAARNVVLYVARSLKEHTLLQAIARVNRLHSGKDFGYVIDYHGVLEELHDALELYSALEGKFDQEDLEGTLTNLSVELRSLPGLHDAVWDLFREVRNKKDEEAFELALEDPGKRDEFYTKVSKFCRVLKMALSSIHWVRATPAATAERYKRDAFFFQKLRGSVKIRYAEEIDYREDEAQIQKMLTTYVQAGEVIQVVDPVNIFEREAFQREVDQASSPRAKADIIVNRTKRTITEKMEEDPFFYRKLSKLLEQTIAEYRGKRIDEAQYLAKSIEILQAVRVGKTQDAPAGLQARDFARALFGVLNESLGASVGGAGAEEPSIVREAPPGAARLGHEPQEDVLASAACRIEEIVRGHAVVKWRENEDAKNRMRNDIDDFLFALQSEKGFRLTMAQMDSILEAVLSIAQSRTVDV